MSYLDNNFYKGADSTEGISFTNPYGNNYKWYHYFFAFLLFVFAYWGITTNSDWTAYETWYNNDITGVDKAFAFLSTWFNNHGLTFRMLYRFHIILMSLFFTILFKRININPVICTIIMLIFNYVALGNQIRYYVGLPLAMLSIIYYIDKRYILSGILCVLSYFFHSSLLLFIAVFFLYYYIIRNLKSTRYLVIIITNIVIYFLLHEYLSSEHYEVYLLGERASGVLGGIYNLFPSLVYIYFADKIDKIIREDNPEYALTREYTFTHVCIMMGVVLIMCSLQTQILAHRMMGISLSPIWFSFLVNANKINNKRISRLVFTCLAVLFTYYTLHNFGGLPGSSENLYQIREMLNSYSLH